MSALPSNTKTEHETCREMLIEGIVFKIQQDLEDEIPPDFPGDSR
jgi:hypothetical protein